MQCRTCEYRLWNLRARQCPECGTAFLPSEYEFVPHSVAFCCPHCDQPYYGTTAAGHLDPVEFDCVKCGRHVHMNEMVLRPTDSVPEDLTRPDANPWLERKNRNWFGAFFTTLGRGMVSPIKLMHVTPAGSPVGEAVWFAFWAILLSSSLGMIVFLGIMIAMMFGRSGAGEIFVMFLIGCGPLIAGLLFMAVWGLVTHWLLCIRNKPAAGLARTYQALCYTAGGNVFYAVPCLSLYVAWIGWVWWTVSAALAVKEAQKVTGTRAALAVCAFPAAWLLAMAGGFAGLMVYSIMQAQSSMHGIAQSQAQQVSTALYTHATAHAGLGPAHAAELIGASGAASNVHSFTFLAGGSNSWNSPVGNTTLDQFHNLTPAQQQAAVQAAIAQLPPNPVAHRLGDFVFTYHGIDFNTADPTLWTFVVWPDNPQPVPFGVQVITAGLADGTTQDIPMNQFASELSAQNTLRAQEQLPPLPDPATVKHPPQVTPPAATPAPPAPILTPRP